MLDGTAATMRFQVTVRSAVAIRLLHDHQRNAECRRHESRDLLVAVNTTSWFDKRAMRAEAFENSRWAGSTA